MPNPRERIALTRMEMLREVLQILEDESKNHIIATFVEWMSIADLETFIRKLKK